MVVVGRYPYTWDDGLTYYQVVAVIAKDDILCGEEGRGVFVNSQRRCSIICSPVELFNLVPLKNKCVPMKVVGTVPYPFRIQLSLLSRALVR